MFAAVPIGVWVGGVSACWSAEADRDDNAGLSCCDYEVREFLRASEAGVQEFCASSARFAPHTPMPVSGVAAVPSSGVHPLT